MLSFETSSPQVIDITEGNDPALAGGQQCCAREPHYVIDRNQSQRRKMENVAENMRELS